MRWKLKARIQNAIATLPFGRTSVYFAVQRTVGGLRKGLNNPLDRFAAAVKMVDWIESAGGTIAGKRFLEVGTGHMVNLPTAFWLLGARETLTVDLYQILSPAIVAESNRSMRGHKDEILALFGRHADDTGFRTRFDQLLSFSGTLESLLEMMNVRYLSPGDAGALPLPDMSMDFHVSHTVLEHIPESVITAILREAKRILIPGGLLVHNIDPSDHFSHDDPSICAVNFLRFTDREWDKWAGNQFMYQNRLRSSDYLRLFEDAGIKILKSRADVDAVSLAGLENGFIPAGRFSTMAHKDLATTRLRLMGGFGR